MFPLTLISVLGSLAFFGYVAYMELYFIGPQYAKYPPPVEDALRTAIYYTEVDLNPPKALNAYKQALELAKEAKMHPFSKEVLGIRLQVAHMLEKGGLIRQAIEVFERVKAECLTYVERGGERRPLPKDQELAKLERDRAPIPVDNPEFVEAIDKMKEIYEYNDRQRTLAMKTAVGISLKLGDLYLSEQIGDEKKAEACQVSGVELCLKEMHRRQKHGLPVGKSSDENDPWLGLSEIGSVLTDLGDTYAGQRKDELALPLYLRALDLIRVDEADSPSCRQAVLLNNIAATMAAMVESPRAGNQPIMPRDLTMDTARQWALKAIEVAGSVSPSIKDEECDSSCCAATLHLGTMAEFQGKREEAVKYYEQSRSMAKSLGLEEVVLEADEKLENLRRSAGKE